MKKMFCEYCGKPLSEGCECERIIADYMNDPEVHYGWHQQNMIDMRRRER